MVNKTHEIGWRKELLEENQTTSNGLPAGQANRITMKKSRSSSSTDSSRSSSCSSSSTANSNCDENDKQKRKRIKKEKRREEKKLRKESKRLEKSERKQLKKAKKELHKEEKKLHKEEKRKRKLVKKAAKKPKIDDKNDDCAIPIDLMYTKAQAPETPEEYKARQSQIRREVDPITGRSRLIKGDGEVLEEIVSRERHLNINKQANLGDGQYFQQNTINLNK